MVYERTGYAPWSLTREAGVQSATVDSQIQVPQYLQPIVDTGIIDEKGDWKGIKSSDEQFIGLSFAEAIPNGGEVLFPDTAEVGRIDMTGFSSLFIALKPTNGGNVAITAVMGPDTTPFANLSPVNPASTLKGVSGSVNGNGAIVNIQTESADTLTADVWNIYYFRNILADQKNMQFKIVNNSGGNSNIEFGFMRLI